MDALVVAAEATDGAGLADRMFAILREFRDDCDDVDGLGLRRILPLVLGLVEVGSIDTMR